MSGRMGGEPQRRRQKAWIGAMLGLGLALAVSVGLMAGLGEPVVAKSAAAFAAIRPDGKLVLRVEAPRLY